MSHRIHLFCSPFGIATAELVVNNFINRLISTTTKDALSRRKAPLSIIISKADFPDGVKDKLYKILG